MMTGKAADKQPYQYPRIPVDRHQETPQEYLDSFSSYLSVPRADRLAATRVSTGISLSYQQFKLLEQTICVAGGIVAVCSGVCGRLAQTNGYLFMTLQVFEVALQRVRFNHSAFAMSCLA
jgi:hypothetical protein